MADSQELQKLEQSLTKIAGKIENVSKLFGSADAQASKFASTLKEFASGDSTAFSRLLQQTLSLNNALKDSTASKSQQTYLKNLSAEALKTADSFRRATQEAKNLSDAASGGGNNSFAGKMQRTDGSGYNVGTLGTAFGGAGAFTNPEKIKQGVHAAVQQMQTDYGALASEINNVTATVDQMTGRIMVQAEIVKDLGDGVKQTATVRTTHDPFTNQSSNLSDAQQSFINQAGGLDRANQMLAQYGLTIRNVTGYYKDLNSNVSRFSVVGTDGISQSMGAMDQFGNATLHAARNAQTLLQNVTRNVAKVLEWSLATGLVYAAMNSVTQATRELDDIEETMTDIAIATGAAGDELQRFYDTALATANLTGVDVTETLEAQAKAFRAAASESDRFTAANTLLRDSLILSRLSGMQQAEALDTLVAALRQTGMSITSGTTLLDKWVKTSKNAGVSIQDLAQSFAITSDVASTVGISVDELNGLIATLAEKTILSSTEIGNALRTLFSNITSDEAVRALQEVGIAVENVDGSMRNWMEINQNIVDLMNSGALNNEQLNRLANALGGGSRRGPQLLALWTNFARVGDVAADSLNANGEAADAMAAKLETLQAAVNEMHNAFNELVQALGYDGGFLELAIDAIKITTDLVKGMTDVAETFESGAASIAAMTIAFIGLQRVAGAINWQSIAPTTTQRDAFGNRIGGNNQQGFNLPNYLGQQPNLGTWSGRAQFGVQSTMQAAPVIAGEIVRGISEGDNVGQIGARVGGSIAGAVVGNLILPGAGGLVGAVIGDAFVNQVQSKQEAMRALALGQPTTSAGQLDLLTKAYGGSLNVLGGVDRDLRHQFSDEDLMGLLVESIQSGLYDKVPKGGLPGIATGAIERNSNYSAEESKALAQMFNMLNANNIEELVTGWEKYQRLKAEEIAAVNRATELMSPATAQQIGKLVTGTQGQGLRGNFAGQRDALISQAALTGDTQKLTQTSQAMEQVATATAAVAVAMGDANISTSDYIALGNVLLDATDAERERIILLTSEINNLQNAQEQYIASQKSGRGGFGGYGDEIRAAREELERTVQLTERAAEIRLARDNYRSFSRGPEDGNGNLVSANSVNFYGLLDQARQMQAEYAKFLGIEPDALRASVTDPLVLAFADGYHQVEGLTGDFANWFVDQMKEAAEEASEAMTFSFRDLGDMSAGNFDQIKRRAKYYEQFLEKNYGPYGYEEDKQNIGLLFKDNQAKTLNTTMTALNLAIEELTEVEKKQLEGVWNLPSGATAYVPITSLFYSQQQNQNSAFDPAANKIDNAGNTMERAANTFANAVQAERAINEHMYRAPTARQYANATQAERGIGEHMYTVNVNVEPQDTIVNLDGRAVATAVSKYNNQNLQQTLRSKGKVTTVAI